MNKEIGKRLKAVRNKHNISQKDLARLLGLSSYTSISKVERGERALTIDMILKLESNFEDLDLHWLITGEQLRPTVPTTEKYYCLEFFDDDDRIKFTATNNGFNSFELLGMLQTKASDLYQQIIGNIMPEFVHERNFIERPEAPANITLKEKAKNNPCNQ